MITSRCPQERPLRGLYALAIILLVGGLIVFVAGVDLQNVWTPILYDIGTGMLVCSIICIILGEVYKYRQATERV